jgi:hypothetical protein
MNIETKFEPGDIVYFFKETKQVQGEIKSIVLEIDMRNKKTYECMYTIVGDRSKEKIQESFLFKTIEGLYSNMIKQGN